MPLWADPGPQGLIVSIIKLGRIKLWPTVWETPGLYPPPEASPQQTEQNSARVHSRDGEGATLKITF